MAVNGLLTKVKQNLIINFDDDDILIQNCIAAAIAYAEDYQHLPCGYYKTHDIKGTTEQGIIMLASYFYESRDGSGSGFFGSSVSASQQALAVCNDLLRMNREWTV